MQPLFRRNFTLPWRFVRRDFIRRFAVSPLSAQQGDLNAIYKRFNELYLRAIMPRRWWKRRRSRHGQGAVWRRPRQLRRRALQPGQRVQVARQVRRRRGGSTSARWRSKRRRSAQTAPKWPKPSTTWPSCTGARQVRRGRGALQARAGDQEKALGADIRSSPQPSTTWPCVRGARQIRRRRGSLQARAGDLGEGARRRPPRCGYRPEQPGRRVRDRQGKYADAEGLYKRALAIQREGATGRTPRIAATFVGLANRGRGASQVRRRRGALQARAGDQREGTRRRPPRSRSQPSTTWPSCTSKQGKYAEAEELDKRALAIDEKALGMDHPAVANILNGLARLYQGKPARARTHSPIRAKRRQPHAPMWPW